MKVFITKENYNKLQLINDQILTRKALEIFTKNVLQSDILFLVIGTTLASDNLSRFIKESFRKNMKTNHDN